MPPKGCPHCGNKVPIQTARCACGFRFRADGPEVPGARAAREVSQTWSQRLRKRVKPARSAGLAKASSSSSSRAGRTRGGANSNAASQTEIDLDLPESKEALLMLCPGCGIRISRRARHCPKCGEVAFTKCGVCGERILSGSSDCPECGDPEPFGP